MGFGLRVGSAIAGGGEGTSAFDVGGWEFLMERATHEDDKLIFLASSFHRGLCVLCLS